MLVCICVEFAAICYCVTVFGCVFLESRCVWVCCAFCLICNACIVGVLVVC